jgi:hypothetical protein
MERPSSLILPCHCRRSRQGHKQHGKGEVGSISVPIPAGMAQSRTAPHIHTQMPTVSSNRWRQDRYGQLVDTVTLSLAFNRAEHSVRLERVRVIYNSDSSSMKEGLVAEVVAPRLESWPAGTPKLTFSPGRTSSRLETSTSSEEPAAS